jgi:hypothetical protein
MIWQGSFIESAIESSKNIKVSLQRVWLWAKRDNGASPIVIQLAQGTVSFCDIV